MHESQASAQIPQSKPDQEDLTRVINGVRRYPVDGYWIKYYKPHHRKDFETVLKMISSFEDRFRKAVDYGKESDPDSKKVELLRRQFKQAQEDKVPDCSNDKSGYKCLDAEAKVTQKGGKLAVAVYRMMIQHMKEHLERRIRNFPVFDDRDRQKLEELERKIGEEWMETYRLFNHIKRTDGIADRDGVLAEMRGEPFFLFSTTQRGSSDKALETFYHGRYLKIAQAWKNIDESTAAILALVRKSALLNQSPLEDMIKGFHAAAKSRCELMSSDHDYEEAADGLRRNRDLIAKLDEKHRSIVNAQEKGILDLVEDYRKLVYDIAHVRAPRKVSTRELVEKAKELTEQMRQTYPPRH